MTVTHDVSVPYFFLSYARSDPLAGNPEEDPEEPVETFFADLTDAVRRHAAAAAKMCPGSTTRRSPSARTGSSSSPRPSARLRCSSRSTRSDT